MPVLRLSWKRHGLLLVGHHHHSELVELLHLLGWLVVLLVVLEEFHLVDLTLHLVSVSYSEFWRLNTHLVWHQLVFRLHEIHILVLGRRFHHVGELLLVHQWSWHWRKDPCHWCFWNYEILLILSSNCLSALRVVVLVLLVDDHTDRWKLLLSLSWIVCSRCLLRLLLRSSSNGIIKLWYLGDSRNSVSIVVSSCILLKVLLELDNQLSNFVLRSFSLLLLSLLVLVLLSLSIPLLLFSVHFLHHLLHSESLTFIFSQHLSFQLVLQFLH